MDTKDRVDIIVLGATGFTGKRVVKNLALLCRESEYLDIKWGIAGRSKQKLQNLLSELEELGVNILAIPVLECDIKDQGSIINTSGRTKILLNSTGPNSDLSEPVVKACITTRTHYVDISAELYLTVNLCRKYHREAEEKNVLIIPACGFISIPVLTGLLQLERAFQGTLHSVECYTELCMPKSAYIPGPNKCLIHYGTWEWFVLELQHFREYKKLKKKTFPELEPVPDEMRKCFFHKHENRWWFPDPSPDNDIVQMTQTYLREKKGKQSYHFKIYRTMPLLIHFFIIIPAFFIAYLLSYFTCFTNLLKKHPRFFTLGYISHQGPTEEMINDTKYSITLTGKGWLHETDLESPPDKTLSLKISGSDPVYKTTAIAFISAAITILREGDKMPNGGVLTTGAAFCDTEIVDRLNKHGILFTTAQNSNKTFVT